MYEGKRVGGQVPQLRFDLAGGIALWRPAVGRSRWSPFTTAGNPSLPIPGWSNGVQQLEQLCQRPILSQRLHNERSGH